MKEKVSINEEGEPIMDKKKLPIGLSDFRRLIEDDYYYVDKTIMIEEVLQAGALVTLITRPRRFGKTLNMTMLREFFSMDVDSKEIFAGLKIMGTKYVSEMNKYPVLFFSFKDVKGNTAIDLVKKMKMQILDEYLRYEYLFESLNVYDKKKLAIILEALQKNTERYDDVDTAIYFLSSIVCKYLHVRPILLMDEYDTPMISAYELDSYDELRNFFRNLFSTALKDNPYLNFAVMTGIQRVAKENIFSGLNNLVVCTVLDEEYNQQFGLTIEETREFLHYYNSELTEEISDMYNGYNFAGEQIFNPWSIINYGSKKKLEAYWVNTSSNMLIRQLITEVDFNFVNVFEELLQTGVINVPVNLSTTFFELRTAANFWGLFINAGYLTLAKQPEVEAYLYSLRIPNGEVKKDFRALVAHYVGLDPSLPEAMFGYLLIGDIKNFQATYQEILLNCTSFYDLRENAYHMLFLGMSFYLEKRYIIKSNIEAGHGRADIIYTAKKSGDPNLIIEFKQGEDLAQLAEQALEQIKAKKYYAGLRGKTLLVGVAHFKKKVKCVVEMIDSNL